MSEAPKRDLWIDQPYAESTWRVRELYEGTVKELGSFATREQAQIFLEETLNPPAPEPSTTAPADAAATVQQKARPTWTRGVAP
jgi:hypothetical protein